MTDREKLEPLSNVPVEVTVVLGQTRLTIGQLLALEEGAVLELDRGVNDEVDVCVNGSVVAKGELMVENGRLGSAVAKVLEEENACG